MVVHADDVDLEVLVARLAATDDAAARARLLQMAVDPHTARGVAERLKEEADRARYQDYALALRWSDDIIALGAMAAAPTVVALGHMVAALIIYDQGQYSASLARFDQAGALFRAHGDEVGWARTQIGRIGPCRVLGRFDEALERAQQARDILEGAGEHLRVAGIDANLAMLLERMNRLTEALDFNQRALAVYRASGSTYYALHLLRNYALLLWRLGRVREALEAHVEARQGYLELGAATDAAREDLNIGAVYIALGHYADAVSVLLGARKAFLAATLPDSAALAGLFLAECYYQLGRYRDVIAITPALRDEFTLCGITVEHVQALVWEALAQAGLADYDAALRALDGATALLAPHDHLASYRATVDVERAGLLLEWGRLSEARALLEVAIPPLREAGLAMKVATAQVLLGRALIEEGHPADAHAVAADALTMAQREGLDWLAVRALHLRGVVAMRSGRDEHAQADLSGAMRHLDRVHRRVTWDDRATFSGTAAAVYADAVGLALRQGQPGAALSYAERAKARALAEHLRGHIDVRPRARDDSSRALVEELAALRDRYAWLNAVPDEPAGERSSLAAAVRWAAGPALDAATRVEATRVEGRMAAVWRELQANNPAYRGEVAALDPAAGDEDAADDDGESMQRWIHRLHAVLGTDGRVALLEYTAQGDDLVLFVVRAGQAHAVRLAGAQAAARQLVALLRLNVESSASAVARGGGTMRALATNVRGLLRRLHTALLAPALPLLDGVERLVIVPHGATHHVPFHALYDGFGYLLERHEIGYAPCASLLAHFDERHRQLSATTCGSGGDALVVCCSAAGALPHVVPEGQAVVAALGGRLLCEEEATLPMVRALGSSAAVIHLAAHAVFRPDEPLFSSLQLCDGRLTTLDMFDLELRCSLVTLSACETSLGTAGAGDELMGLSRALLYAGAPSLILSLWKVEDRSTAILMERLYRALRRGERKGAALRQAQLALLRDEGDEAVDLSAPFFWAPFQIIGHTGTL